MDVGAAAHARRPDRPVAFRAAPACDRTAGRGERRALAVGVEESAGRVWLALSCLLLLTGALCWSWSVYLRFGHVREFALGELPGWPFASYVGVVRLAHALGQPGFPRRVRPLR